MIKEEANEVKKFVGNYMEIVDTTIRDMTPKYIMCSLVGALQDYVKDELTSDLLEGRSSPEAQQELLKWEESSRVPELLKIRDCPAKTVPDLLCVSSRLSFQLNF